MNKIQAYFDSVAETYDSQKYVLNRDTKAELELITTLFENDLTSYVLDVGCGTGRLTHEFYRAGYSIDGIDISLKMIDACKVKYPEMKNQFRCIDFYSLDNCKYDVVLSVMGGAFGLTDEIEKSEDIIDAFMKKLHEIMSDSSIAIIEFLNLFTVFREVEEEDIRLHNIDLHRNLVRYSESLWERGFTPIEITRIAEENGFKVESIFSKNNQELLMVDINIKDITGVVVLRKSS